MPTAGIHVVTTTYGTWLPGDDRGHWSPLFDFCSRVIQRGCHLNLPDQNTHRLTQSLITDPAKTLDDVEQVLIGSVIGGLVHQPRSHSPGFSRGISRGLNAANPGPRPRPGLNAGAKYPLPSCHAAAIEPTHAHLLFGPVAEPLHRFVGRIKGMTSSAVLKLTANRDRRRTWTAGYCKVFLFDAESVLAVQQYIESHNLRRHLPARRFDFVQPLPT